MLSGLIRGAGLGLKSTTMGIAPILHGTTAIIGIAQDAITITTPMTGTTETPHSMTIAPIKPTESLSMSENA
jgi:hypothetical protein